MNKITGNKRPFDQITLEDPLFSSVPTQAEKWVAMGTRIEQIMASMKNLPDLERKALEDDLINVYRSNLYIIAPRNMYSEYLLHCALILKNQGNIEDTQINLQTGLKYQKYASDLRIITQIHIELAKTFVIYQSNDYRLFDPLEKWIATCSENSPDTVSQVQRFCIRDLCDRAYPRFIRAIKEKFWSDTDLTGQRNWLLHIKDRFEVISDDSLKESLLRELLEEIPTKTEIANEKKKRFCLKMSKIAYSFKFEELGWKFLKLAKNL